MLDYSDWPLLVGVGSCALGGLFIYFYRHTNEHLHFLKGVQECGVDNDLYEKVKCAGGTLSYVAVKGNVYADDKVIQGVHNTEAEGVIRKIKIREHKSKWNSTTKSWYDTTKRISSLVKEEPFSLVREDVKSREPISTKVHVKDPCSAYKLELTTIADKYEPSLSSASEHILNYVSGEKVKGIQTIEKMLLINAERTIIGEVELTQDDKLVIKTPNDYSLRYYITSNGIKGIIEDEEGVMQVWKIFAIICFLVAGGISAFWLFKRYCKYLENQQYLKWQKEMEEFNESIDCDDNRICSICLTDPRDIVFLPCGHVCACSRCCSQLDKCPVCRGSIESKSAIFFS